MTRYHPRADWTGAPAAGSAMPSDPRGVAVHWPGSTHPLGNPSWRTIANRLEGYRRYHVNGNGWSDIAYQVAFDQSGGVWDLRGITRMSAANGDRTQNQRWGAVLFLVGPGEAPSPEMLAAFNDWRRDKWLARYPNATRVVSHRDVRPQGTTCPGPITHALVQSGRILTSPTAPTEEDDMPSPQEIAQAVWDFPAKSYVPGSDGQRRAQTALHALFSAHKAATNAATAATVDVHALADALAGRLPAGSTFTTDQLEEALRRVLGSVDQEADRG